MRRVTPAHRRTRTTPYPLARTTVGYGDITSANDLERCFAILGMIIGATVFGYIIGNVAVIMENFDVVDAIESGKMNQIKDWLFDRKVRHTLLECLDQGYNTFPAPKHASIENVM